MINAKVGGGAIGGGAVIAGTTKVALDATNSSENNSKPTNYNLLALVDNFSSNYGADKFGYAFGRFMVDKQDDNWWSYIEKVIDQRETPLSGDFQKPNEEEKKKDYLKLACDTVYKKLKTDVSGELETNTWLVCSPLGVKPKFLSEVDGNSTLYNDKWGWESDIRESLLATNENVNDEAWQHLWKHFYKKLLDSNNIYERDKFYGLDSSDKLVKKCNEAYLSLPKTERSSSWYPSDVVRFCSLDFSIDKINSGTSSFKFPTEPS